MKLLLVVVGCWLLLVVVGWLVGWCWSWKDDANLPYGAWCHASFEATRILHSDVCMILSQVIHHWYWLKKGLTAVYGIFYLFFIFCIITILPSFGGWIYVGIHQRSPAIPGATKWYGLHVAIDGEQLQLCLCNRHLASPKFLGKVRGFGVFYIGYLRTPNFWPRNFLIYRSYI